MKSPRGLTVTASLVALAIVLAVVVTGVVLLSRQATAPSPGGAGSGGNTNQTECTLEAKLCPDGSSVGRVPPTCQFAACPNANANTNVSQIRTDTECQTYCQNVDYCPPGTGSERGNIRSDGTCECGCLIPLENSQSENTDASNATEGWKTYSNETLGLSFRYPPSWGIPQTVESEAPPDPSSYDKGKTITIHFESSSPVISSLRLIAASDGAQRFKQALYDGGDDLAQGCRNPGVVFQGTYTQQICRAATVAEQTTYELFENDGDECSFWNTRSVRLNFNDDVYSGLYIKQSFGSEVLCIPREGMTEEEMVTYNRDTGRKELENLYNRNGLETTDLAALDDFSTFLSTLTFTDSSLTR